MRSIALLAAVCVSCLIAWLAWSMGNRPVAVEPSWNEPLSSVSFAPFRRGQSPLTKVYPTPQQIESDLKLLVGRARGIRTYTAREGMDVVPELAAKYGLKVIFSAWLGTKQETNEKEVDALIAAANAHPDAIDRVLVGNEVLLRRDLTPEQLIGYIRKVKAAVKQPVSYADVWAFYLKHPEVGREVDYITIHILPFWEDEPVAIDHVEEHIVKIVDKIRATFPGKPILIGEAGWPSLGRDRGPAVVSTVNEARFVRQMADIAARHGFDYNVVEAFDQPWKSALENTVGASWGVFDIDRNLKFTMAGPVTEVANWPLRAAVAIVAGALAALWFGRGLPGVVAPLTLALTTQLLSWLAVTTVFHAEAVSFRWWQDIWAVFRGGLAVVTALAIIERAGEFLRSAELALHDHGKADRWWGGPLLIANAIYAMVWTLLLLVDGRYRDIPDIDFSVPAAGLLLLLLLRLFQVRRQGGRWLPALAFDGLFASRLGRRSHEILWAGRSRWLVWGLPLAALAALVSEGLAVIGEDFTKDHPTFADQWPLVLQACFANREMILWAVMLLVMSIPFVANHRLSKGRTPRV